jgi:O-methyltransferase
MKKCLTRILFPEEYQLGALPKGRRKRALYQPVGRWLEARNLTLARRKRFSLERRVEGLDWPAEAETMIGLRRLDNIQHCVTEIIRNDVPGDLIETGVWRGGAVIFMRAILRAYGDTERLVWAADSFKGLPQPDPERYPVDEGDTLWSVPLLAVSEEQVRANFARYGLLDDQVRFLAGWFRDTLPVAPIERLSLIRLDGDMYESTMDALTNLYPKLSVGGYVIVDDYDAVLSCPVAIHDFREMHGITEPMQRIDRLSVFWQRRS